jgi:hypothetical protein
LTLLEVLVVPYRAGNRLLAERYEALLTRSRGIRLVDICRATSCGRPLSFGRQQTPTCLTRFNWSRLSALGAPHS